ncbi:MAG: hypothetical protein AAGC95_15695 [Pseudomonadota bacterium]
MEAIKRIGTAYGIDLGYIYTEDEAALKLNRSKNFIRGLYRKRLIPRVRMGVKLIGYFDYDLCKYLSECVEWAEETPRDSIKSEAIGSRKDQVAKTITEHSTTKKPSARAASAWARRKLKKPSDA